MSECVMGFDSSLNVLSRCRVRVFWVGVLDVPLFELLVLLVPFVGYGSYLLCTHSLPRFFSYIGPFEIMNLSMEMMILYRRGSRYGNG
jgi:hypothetical protein